MGKTALRIVGDEKKVSSAPPATVRLRLGDVFPLLLHAHRQSYAWLKDMADDEILVTADLAEILATFEDYMRKKRRA